MRARSVALILILAIAGVQSFAQDAVTQKASMSPNQQPIVHHIKLMPPPDPGFHDAMGGWPMEIHPDTFHAATGEMVIYEHANGNTDIYFTFKHLLPFGVYTLWDVTNPNYATGEFADQPLADMLPVTFENESDALLGGIKGFGVHGFRADINGNAQAVVHLTTHRPGKEFLLDYHADGAAKGGPKGEKTFPGVLWGKFPYFH